MIFYMVLYDFVMKFIGKYDKKKKNVFIFIA